VQRVVDITDVTSPEGFFDVFFAATAGLVPDYGGRNLDALIDDLADIEARLTLVLVGCGQAATVLGDWLDRLLGSLALAIARSDNKLTVVLQGPPET
jgi:RNAse (barnase) inhibitor barstar